MPSRKQAPDAGAESPVKKKAKVAQSRSNNGQASLGAFFQSPGNSKASQSQSKSSKGKASKNDVIDLLSDDDDEEEDIKPVASTSRAVATGRDAVINLDDMDSSDDEEITVSATVNKPTKTMHPLFASPKTAKAEPDMKPFADNNEDIKPTIASNGKGKARALDSPTKLIFPSGANNGEAIVYPLDTDIFLFDPAKDISTTTWPRTSAGKLQIPYSFLTAAFVLVSATRARLIITTVLTNTLRTIVEYQPEVLRECVYLVSSEDR
jgi:DNA ligase-1